MRVSSTVSRGAVAAAVVPCILAATALAVGGRAQAAEPKNLWVSPPDGTQCMSLVVTRPDADGVRWAIHSHSANTVPSATVQHAGRTYVDTRTALLPGDAVQVSSWSGTLVQDKTDEQGSCSGDMTGHLEPYTLPDVPEFLIIVP